MSEKHGAKKDDFSKKELIIFGSFIGLIVLVFIGYKVNKSIQSARANQLVAVTQITTVKDKHSGEIIRVDTTETKLPRKRVGDRDFVRTVKDTVSKSGRKVLAKQQAKFRGEYAKALRAGFLDKGLNIDVAIIGDNNDKIVLTYSLMGDVFVHNYQKSPQWRELKKMGFKSVNFKSGLNLRPYDKTIRL